MAQQQNERPKPHGDPLEEATAHNGDDNQAQRQSDAQPDETVRGVTEDPSERSDRAHGAGSDANGVPAFDEADGDRRKKLYEDGAELVSRID